MDRTYARGIAGLPGLGTRTAAIRSYCRVPGALSRIEAVRHDRDPSILAHPRVVDTPGDLHRRRPGCRRDPALLRGRPCGVLEGDRAVPADPAVPSRLGVTAGVQREHVRLAATVDLWRAASNRRRLDRHSSCNSCTADACRLCGRRRLDPAGHDSVVQTGVHELLLPCQWRVPHRRSCVADTTGTGETGTVRDRKLDDYRWDGLMVTTTTSLLTIMADPNTVQALSFS